MHKKGRQGYAIPWRPSFLATAIYPQENIIMEEKIRMQLRELLNQEVVLATGWPLRSVRPRSRARIPTARMTPVGI